MWHKITELHGQGVTPALVPDQAAEALQWQDPHDDYRTLAKATLGYQTWRQHYATRKRTWIRSTEIKYENRRVQPEPRVGIVDAIIDMDVGQGRGTERWAVDYKTTSRLESDWVLYYRLSNQFRYYYLDLLELEPTLAGVVVDLYHCTKGNSKGKSEGEREGNRFYELVIRLDEMNLDEAVKDYETACQLAAFYEQLGYYPKNTGACHAYNSKCRFLEHCDASDEVRDIIALTYTTRERNTDDGRTIIE